MRTMKKILLSLASAAALVAVTGNASAAGISDDVVKIGVLTDMSGVYSDIGGEGAVIAAKMAVEDYGGKVLGKKVEVVSADHQNKPDIASAKAREWIDNEGVDVITELLNSGVGIAVQKLASEKKTITLNTGAGSTALTNKDCTKYGIHYVYDTYSLPVGTATAMVKGGGKSWFFITADYSFGHSLEQNTSKVVKEEGGKVVGGVQAPLGTTDFSSYLLQAKSSGADVIGLANAGGDFTNAVKQANEFGIVQGGQKLAGMLVFLTDVKSLGLDVAQGLNFTVAWYWDQNDQTRAFAKRFMKRHGAMPTMVQAGLYSAVTNYLKAIEAAGTDDSDAVRAQLGKMQIDDMFAKGHIRKDGLFVHDMFLARAKKPSESKGEWDLMSIERRIPGDQAFMSLDEGSCSMAK